MILHFPPGSLAVNSKNRKFWQSGPPEVLNGSGAAGSAIRLSGGNDRVAVNAWQRLKKWQKILLGTKSDNKRESE